MGKMDNAGGRSCSSRALGASRAAHAPEAARVMAGDEDLS